MIILKANKYHDDSGFQIEPDYSKNAIKLSSGPVGKFVPKSIVELIKTKAAGEYEVRVPKWFAEKPENKQFFNKLL